MYLTSCSALSPDHLPVIIDTMYHSSFLHPLDCLDFKRTDWTNFQAHLDDKIPINPEFHNGVAINTCVENMSGAVLKDLAASTPKNHPRDNPRSPIPAGIQNEVHLKNRLQRQLQVTRDPL